MADAVGVAEHGDERVALDVLHERVRSAGNDEVDELVHAEQGLDGFAAIDAADRVGRDAAVRRERGVHGVEDGAHGVLDFAATLEDDGVAGLDGECADLGDGVGARLEDDGEYAERHGDFFEREAVGEEGAVEDAAGGIGQLAHGAHCLRP